MTSIEKIYLTINIGKCSKTQKISTRNKNWWTRANLTQTLLTTHSRRLGGLTMSIFHLTKLLMIESKLNLHKVKHAFKQVHQAYKILLMNSLKFRNNSKMNKVKSIKIWINWLKTHSKLKDSLINSVMKSFPLKSNGLHYSMTQLISKRWNY